MKYTLYICLLFSLCFFSCQDFISENHIVGRYYLLSNDVLEDQSLVYRLDNGDYIGIVSETVFAIGYNENYIIVKQHPNRNRKYINYFIVPIYKEKTLSPEKGVKGPFSLEVFEQTREKLDISEETHFETEIEELE